MIESEAKELFDKLYAPLKDYRAAKMQGHIISRVFNIMLGQIDQTPSRIPRTLHNDR